MTNKPPISIIIQKESQLATVFSEKFWSISITDVIQTLIIGIILSIYFFYKEDRKYKIKTIIGYIDKVDTLLEYIVVQENNPKETRLMLKKISTISNKIPSLLSDYKIKILQLALIDEIKKYDDEFRDTIELFLDKNNSESEFNDKIKKNSMLYSCFLINLKVLLDSKL